MNQKPFDRKLAKDNPERRFDSPREVVEQTLLTKGEKIATLTRWRQSVLEELSATGEGMRTHGISAERAQLLEQIEEARRELTGDAD